MAFKSIKSMFYPKYPEKYIGNANNIICRSNLEKKFCQYWDNNPNILSWASEEISIEYISPVDNKIHRYFPDFYVKVKNINGSITKLLIEIKPDIQTKEPIKKGKKTQNQFIMEKITYDVNIAKWNAAAAFCKKHGLQFKIMTEKIIKE